MTTKLLNKGLEVELFAGTNEGKVLPLSGELKDKFENFSQEPDQRNFEYITNPTRDYIELFKLLLEPRIKARTHLKKNDLTIIPGSTLALPFEKTFYYSKPEDPYHQYILSTYKTDVITTSLHINFGIDDKENFFKLLCALRLDTPLFLALSASSCFLDGKITDYKSYRWHNFPKTPDFVPFFLTHDDYINWTNEQLKLKKMFNIRHLWTSIRPNGPDRPYDLNRIEIRICDLVSDTKKVLAIVALIEVLIQQYLSEKKWPKILNQNQSELNNLVKIIDNQEELVAKSGMSAQIWDWRNDRNEKTENIIESLYKDNEYTANNLGVSEHLKPLVNIIKDGNEATQFLEHYKTSNSIPKTLQHFTEQFNIMDLRYWDMIKNPTEIKF